MCVYVYKTNCLSHSEKHLVQLPIDQQCGFAGHLQGTTHTAGHWQGTTAYGKGAEQRSRVSLSTMMPKNAGTYIEACVYSHYTEACGYSHYIEACMES